ncbi:hypothetical protein VRB37_16890 [Erwinia billingiae]|jgi:hypothetical protein|uniref:hypothetical protein n=1 Tax=Erwinia billingiae TaxID=182337 RepID=UPI0030D61A3C
MIRLFGGYISGTVHRGNQAYLCFQPAQAMSDLFSLKQALPETRQNVPVPGKGLLALAEIANRPKQTSPQFDESPGEKCEYLTLEIPVCPTQEILVYGCAGTVGARYSMRAGQLLSILRETATLLRRSIGRDEQSHFDRILREANAQLRNFSSAPKTRHMRHTCRSLIRVLQQLEEHLRQEQNSTAHRNKDV